MENIQKNNKLLNIVSSKKLILSNHLTKAESYRDHAKNIINNQFSIIKLPTTLEDNFLFIGNNYTDIALETKKEFTFINKTDGFMPLGITYARDKDKIDLCETFNYWHYYRAAHSLLSFSNSLFYQKISECEKIYHEVASKLLSDIANVYSYDYDLNIRKDSYLQFNIYPQPLKQIKRLYLQERHEDGHLLTIIKPNAPGLVIYLDDTEFLVNLEDDEAIVIAGSLLTELSDGIIPPLYHAVLDLNLPAIRTSLIYNVNILDVAIPSFNNKEIRMRDVANQHHMAFGQYPYHS